MMRLRGAAIGLVLIALPTPVLADQVNTISGQVAYVTSTRLGIEQNRQKRDFILDKDFTNIKTIDGKPATRDKITVGSYVRISFLRSSLFGSSRVTEVDLLPAASSPLPIPPGNQY